MQSCSPRLLSVLLVVNVPLAMLLVNACCFVVLQWHLLYTLTLSSPLTPPKTFELVLPTNNSLILPLNLSLPLITNIARYPPKDPYDLGPTGSTIYVSFTNYAEAIPYYTISVVFDKMNNDLRAHLPQDRDKSMSLAERKYKTLGARLTLETGFVTDMTWEQWRHASASIEEFVKRFTAFEFEFEVFSKPKNFLASGALVAID